MHAHVLKVIVSKKLNLFTGWKSLKIHSSYCHRKMNCLGLLHLLQILTCILLFTRSFSKDDGKVNNIYPIVLDLATETVCPYRNILLQTHTSSISFESVQLILLFVFDFFLNQFSHSLYLEKLYLFINYS